MNDEMIVATDERVFMSPNNGNLVVGIPLYTREPTPISSHITVYLESDKPAAYALDFDEEKECIQMFNAEWVESKLIDLGDL